MKTTIGKLRTVIRGVMQEAGRDALGYGIPEESPGFGAPAEPAAAPPPARPVEIGGMSANIAGDYRYTDYLTVHYNPNDDTVMVTVSSQGPVGGMDYDSGGKLYDPSVDFQSSAPASAGELMSLLRGPLRNDHFNFKRYGRPTKNFRWHGVGRGVSTALAAQALAKVRGDKPPLKPAPKPKVAPSRPTGRAKTKKKR